MKSLNINNISRNTSFPSFLSTLRCNIILDYFTRHRVKNPYAQRNSFIVKCKLFVNLFQKKIQSIATKT